jgi:hypothetical protein
VQPAGEDPRTRTDLAAHQAGALRLLGGGVIAVVLGVLLGDATVALVRSAGERRPVLGLAVIALVVAGAAVAVAGAGALLRTHRWRTALAGQPWQHGRLRIAGPAVVAFEPEGYDELDPDDAPVRWRLLSTGIWRTRAVQQLDGAVIRAARVGPRQWVFTADGAGTLWGAREVTR